VPSSALGEADRAAGVEPAEIDDAAQVDDDGSALGRETQCPSAEAW